MSMNLQSFGTQPYFQMQQGKLDVQAKQFIQQFDTDLDGSLSQAELKKSTGLLGPVQTKVSSPQLAQALWASIAGPSNTINAKEYAAFLLRLDDANVDGIITQAEADDWVNRASQAVQAKSPGVNTVARVYNNMITNGNQVGLDQAFGTTQEEQFALGQDTSLKPTIPPVKSFTIPPLNTTALLNMMTESPDATTGAEWKVDLISNSQVQMSNVIGALLTLTADLDENSPEYASLMQRLDSVQKLDSNLQKQKENLSIFPKQVYAELDKQGITLKRSQEQVELSEQIGKLFLSLTQEEPETSGYQLIIAQMNKLAEQEYSLMKRENPDYVRVVQEVSDKNKADILSGKINAQNLPAVEDFKVNYEPLPFSLENIQKGKSTSFQLVLVRQAKEQISNSIKSMFELTKDLDKESPTYQSLMSRLNAVQQIEKSLVFQERRLQFLLKNREQPFTEPSAEMKQYLELAKTVEPEGAEYNKIMAKVQELANTHYNLDGSNPSSLPTTSTSDDLPLFSGTTLKISSITSTTTPANDDIDLPLV